MSNVVYKNSYLTGPFKTGDQNFYNISINHSSFPGPLATNAFYALAKAKEMVDEIGQVNYARNPHFLGSKPYNEFTICPNCGKGNRNDRLTCWNCKWDLISLEKPYFGPPSGVFKRKKIYES